MRMLSKIISGGQTGADRAALDCAIAHGMAHGGAIPAGRKAEDGPLPARYEMRELSSPNYQERTAQNVNDGDGTLIVSHGALSGGSAFTRTVAQRLGKPMLHLDLASIDIETARYQLIGWLWVNKITILNVAGPRASSDPNIYHQTFSLLTAVLSMLTDDTGAGGNQVREGFLPSSASDERVVFELISFGFKYGTPVDVTTILDVRFLPNPYWRDELRALTGRDPRVADYVISSEAGQNFLALLKPFALHLLREGERTARPQPRWATGCTGGRHRSVAVVEELAGFLRAHSVAVTTAHRDIERDAANG
jgi:hypothetical protein